MKKLVVILSAVVFSGAVLTSCKAKTNCQAYSKAEKVKVQKVEVAF